MNSIQNCNEFPKVLVVSVVNWDDNGPTHTEPDLFRRWKSDYVALVYTRSDFPNTGSCDLFFQIAENKVIKSVFKRTAVGKVVLNRQVVSGDDEASRQQEKALYGRNKKKSWILTIAREAIWALGCWKSDGLKKFVSDFEPDVYFFPVYPVAFMGWIQLWILKNNPKPYVCYMADDDYTYIPCGFNPAALFHRFLLRRPVLRLLKGCDELFVISDFEKREIDQVFGKESVVLTKGIDFNEVEKADCSVHQPLRMVYTGKLGMGRASSLALISKALAQVNKENTLITLDIYSPDVADEKTMRMLNENGCRHRGSVGKDEVEVIQRNADVVVFAESLERRHRYAARLSFSTKLTDYFKSGKCIFAIGDRSIAPIAYLVEQDAAIISSSEEEIASALERLSRDGELVSEYGNKAFQCGKKNHDDNVLAARFANTMRKAALRQ